MIPLIASSGWQAPVGTAAAVVGLATGAFAGARWWHRTVIKEVSERTRELRNNGGDSMKDKVDRTAAHVERMDQELTDHKNNTGREFRDIKRMLHDLVHRVDGLYDK